MASIIHFTFFETRLRLNSEGKAAQFLLLSACSLSVREPIGCLANYPHSYWGLRAAFDSQYTVR